MTKTLKQILLFLPFFLSLISISCGSIELGDNIDSAADVATPATPVNPETRPEMAALGNLSQTEKIILSESYTGYLVILIDENIVARMNKEGVLISKAKGNDELFRIQAIISDYSDVSIEPAYSTYPEILDQRRAELEELSGLKLPDLNSTYHIKAKSLDAIQIYRKLRDMQGIVNIYPKLTPQVPSLPESFSRDASGNQDDEHSKITPTKSLATTPDLTPLQGYLYSESTTGGINAKAAWDAGITGQDVIIIDSEYGWNLDHEDLQGSDHHLGGVGCENDGDDPRCPAYRNHGTGMLGILSSLGNGRGITGIAYGAEAYANDVGGGFGYDISRLTDGVGIALQDELPPGTIMNLPIGMSGALSDPVTGCSQSQYGCLPIETNQEDYDAMVYATAAGITIITPAGNGTVSFDDASVYRSWQVNLSTNDSGSIIVGSSWGSRQWPMTCSPTYKCKRQDSNYGSRVNVYAWGDSVVTAGHKYDGNPYKWDTSDSTNPNQSPVPPNTDANTYFINNMGGTCPAAAIVTGAAALVQSYLKQVSTQPATRYLMPLKMREILVNSGVPQSGGGGNIGKQPRVDVAMTLVDQFWAQVINQYPEITTNTELTHDRMIALRQLGIGLICGKADIQKHIIVGANDPSCPELDLWPKGNYIAKDLDFDGDSRADLVSWTNASFKLDLSSQGSSGDNFGAWDIILAYTPIEGRWVWPYVFDMDADGREDFVVYDKEHGKWYIKFTTTELIESGVFGDWDWIIDYSNASGDTQSLSWKDDLKLDPNQSNYSRPAIGFYNDDIWPDIGVSCSDGYWRVDYGGEQRTNYGENNRYTTKTKYLTDAQLAEAPGWAYLGFAHEMSQGLWTYMCYKIPDTLPQTGRVVCRLDGEPDFDFMEGVPYIYGGAEDILLPGKFDGYEDYDALSVKWSDGSWNMAFVGSDYSSFVDISPNNIYGDNWCKPIVADFDGDWTADRAVMCPDGWKIAYSSTNLFSSQRNADGARYVPLDYNVREFSLPGSTYVGGLSYSYVKELIDFYKSIDPSTPPPIPIDMATLNGW